MTKQHTQLLKACQEGNINQVISLYEKYFIFISQTSEAFENAVSHGHMEIVKYLSKFINKLTIYSWGYKLNSKQELVCMCNIIHGNHNECNLLIKQPKILEFLVSKYLPHYASSYVPAPFTISITKDILKIKQCEKNKFEQAILSGKLKAILPLKFIPKHIMIQCLCEYLDQNLVKLIIRYIF
jgi:hypothetical protein